MRSSPEATAAAAADSPPRTAGACPPDGDLLRLLEGPASAAEHGRLRRHLAGCPACLAVCRGLLRVRALPLPQAPLRRPSLGERLRALASLDLPRAVPVLARSDEALPQAEYRAALLAYREGRFSAAIAGLRRARRRAPRLPGIHLYLGACLLHGGRAGEAARVLGDGLAAGAADPGHEQRWYRAQALLRAGRGEEALAELGRVAARRGPYRDRAALQAERLRRLLEGR